MKFIKGDKVLYTNPANGLLDKEIGVVMRKSYSASYLEPMWTVEFIIGIMDVEEKHLSFAELPKGNEGVWTIDEWGSITAVPETEKILCDCGGLKTYNTMEPGYHSTWCRSLK
jgi:hypothetical protein